MTDSVTFLVVRPGRPTHHYIWDAGQARLRVDQLVQPATTLPCDYGTVLSPTWGHELMPGLLFGSAPVATDAIIQARVVGGLRTKSSGQTVALTVSTLEPASDPAADLRESATVAAEQLLPGEQFELVEAATVHEELRRLQRRARMAGAASERTSRPAWQALGRQGQRPLELSHPYSPAEYSLWRLPWRFQTYAPDLLFGDERVHYFIHRPEWRRLLRRGGSGEALLILTDRQVLFLEDAIPPGLSMARWGYRASSVAVERIRNVVVRRRHRWSELHLTIGGAVDDGHVCCAFREGQHEQVELASELLRPFVPGRQPRALMRLYSFAPPYGRRPTHPPERLNLAYLGDEVLTARKRFSRRLAEGEELLADSLLPPLGKAEPTRWLGVTANRLILATEGVPQPLELTHGELTSIELQYSVMGCFIRVTAGQRHWQFDFYSTWFPALHPVYLATRQCMAQPVGRFRRDRALAAS